MSKLSNSNASNDVLQAINMVTMRDISYKEIPINSIIKDSLLEDGTEFNALNLLNNSKSRYNKLLHLHGNSSKHCSKKDKRKKKRLLKFRLDFIDEVEIESYKEHNQKMCYREIEENDEKKIKDCRSCLEKLCVIF